MSVTELLEKIDWSRFKIGRYGAIYARRGRKYWCPLAVATGSHLGYDSETERLTGLTRAQVWAFIDAADNMHSGPVHTRWRQWMLERIAKAQGGSPP